MDSVRERLGALLTTNWRYWNQYSIRSMVVHNPNNWHWVDKNCLPWSKTYLEKEIINTTYTHETITYTLTDINSITGDCDVTQRKGKVLCIYDMKLEFAYKGVQDEDEFTGKIILPEFVHDQEEDEYEFSIDSDSHKSEVRKHLIPVLKQKLMKFQDDLLRAHEKDVQHTTS